MSNLKNLVRVASEKSRVTPKLTGWLANHSEGVVVTDEMGEELLKKLTAAGGSRAYAFHPSQMYQCKRRQVFDYHDVPSVRSFNPQLQNIFNDGTWRHIRWQIMLMNAGILTDVEVSVDMPKYRLQGSMDGIHETTKEKWMFELKGTSQFKTIENSGVTEAHKKQVQAYLLATGYDLAVVIYEDKSVQKWKEFEVQRDENTIKEIVEILEELNLSIDNDELPEVLNECKQGKGATFNACPYGSICRQSQTAEEAKDWGTLVSD
jgi:CRISPR/Cas system-associated exonuclease Cas4 (RecB family)